MADYDGISDFRKVAPQRLRDAKKMLESPTQNQEQGADTRHLRASVYLAGYGIECMLKTYIIDRQPPAKTLTEAMNRRRENDELLKGEPLPDIQGAKGHNLPLLLLLTDLEAGLNNAPDRRKDWAICLSWKSTWRYDPYPPTRQFAEDFVAAADRLYLWIERQL